MLNKNREVNHLIQLIYDVQRLKIKQIKKEVDREVIKIQNIKNNILKDKSIKLDNLITMIAIKSVINKLIKRKILCLNDFIKKEKEKFNIEIEEVYKELKDTPFKRKVDELIKINSIVLDNLYKDFIKKLFNLT